MRASLRGQKSIEHRPRSTYAPYTIRLSLATRLAGDCLVGTDKGWLTEGYTLAKVLIKAEFAASMGDARRLIEGGGVRVNDVVVTDPAAKVNRLYLGEGGQMKLSAGKKRHALIRG